MKMLLLLVGAALLTTACQIEKNAKVTKEAYSYEFDENGCKTHKQSSNSVEGICRKLEDHALNNYCAYGMRSAEYNRYNCFALLGNRPSAY